MAPTKLKRLAIGLDDDESTITTTTRLARVLALHPSHGADDWHHVLIVLLALLRALSMLWSVWGWRTQTIARRASGTRSGRTRSGHRRGRRYPHPNRRRRHPVYPLLAQLGRSPATARSVSAPRSNRHRRG